MYICGIEKGYIENDIQVFNDMFSLSAVKCVFMMGCALWTTALGYKKIENCHLLVGKLYQ